MIFTPVQVVVHTTAELVAEEKDKRFQDFLDSVEQRASERQNKTSSPLESVTAIASTQALRPLLPQTVHDLLDETQEHTSATDEFEPLSLAELGESLSPPPPISSVPPELDAV